MSDRAWLRSKSGSLWWLSAPDALPTSAASGVTYTCNSQRGGCSRGGCHSLGACTALGTGRHGLYDGSDPRFHFEKFPR